MNAKFRQKITFASLYTLHLKGEKLKRIRGELFLEDLELSIEAKHHHVDEKQDSNSLSNRVMNLWNYHSKYHCGRSIHQC